MLASIKGRLKVVKELILAGAEKNASPAGGYSPLFFACHEGQYAVVQCLIEHGANVDGERDDSLQLRTI